VVADSASVITFPIGSTIVVELHMRIDSLAEMAKNTLISQNFDNYIGNRGREVRIQHQISNRKEN